MVDYQMRFQPLIECVNFLEHYINNDRDYAGLYRFQIIEEEKERIEKIKQVCIEVGKLFHEHFQNDDVLFTYISKEKAMSFIKTLIYDRCDFTNDDPYILLDQLTEYYTQDPKRVIEEIIRNEKDEHYTKDFNDENLMRIFDELLIDDKKKWEFWKMQYSICEVFTKMKDIVTLLLPLLDKHKAMFEEGLKAYQTEINQEDQELYERIRSALHFHAEYENIYVIPTLAGCNSLSLLEREATNSIVIIYGIGGYKRMLVSSDISDEALCTVMKLLSDKSKFDILRIIADEKAYGAQIANELNLSTATISYHMQALLNVQLITVEKENNRQYYFLNNECLEKFLKQLQVRLLHK